MLTVYEHPLSPYAQKVKIALREKGVAFERRCRAASAPAARRASSPTPIRAARCRR